MFTKTGFSWQGKSCDRFVLCLEVSFKEVNALVITNKDKSAANGAQHICKVTLEESFATLILDDLLPAIKCTLVHLLSLTRHHHKTSTHCIKGIGNSDRACSYSLSNSKSCEEPRAVKLALSCIICTKIDCPVNNDSLDRRNESWVQSTDNTVSLVTLLDTVSQSLEFSVCSSLANISSKTSSGKIKRIYNHERGSSCSTT